ncbi:hypothetical protein ACJJTC_017130 [Scirpophaga incertulas]
MKGHQLFTTAALYQLKQNGTSLLGLLWKFVNLSRSSPPHLPYYIPLFTTMEYAFTCISIFPEVLVLEQAMLQGDGLSDSQPQGIFGRIKHPALSGQRLHSFSDRIAKRIRLSLAYGVISRLCLRSAGNRHCDRPVDSCKAATRRRCRQSSRVPARVWFYEVLC